MDWLFSYEKGYNSQEMLTNRFTSPWFLVYISMILLFSWWYGVNCQDFKNVWSLYWAKIFIIQTIGIMLLGFLFPIQRNYWILITLSLIPSGIMMFTSIPW